MAVYTQVSDEELNTYLENYDIGELHSLKGIAEGVENTNFLMTTDNGPYLLTLYEKRVSESDLPFFLGLKEHLAAKGFICPQPIKMKSGEVIGTLAGRPSAIVSFLDGVSVKRPQPTHCNQVGRELARMHLLASDFAIPRQNALTLENWRPLYDSCGEGSETVEVGLNQLVLDELNFLESHWPKNLPAGVIHADLFHDNVFFLKNELSGFIDFYFACNDILAYDLAICINAWCFESDLQFNVTKARALILGYHAVRPLSSDEFFILSILCRGSALRFMLTRLYDWLNVPEGALVVPKDPREFIEKLRFHRGIETSALYGVDAQELGLFT